ncbi:hypothetical protein [Bacillus atrophaeus]|nr:hypothetical protein [Bacillus atrophaeus]
MECLNASDSTEQKLAPLDIQQYLVYNALVVKFICFINSFLTVKVMLLL